MKHSQPKSFHLARTSARRTRLARTANLGALPALHGAAGGVPLRPGVGALRALVPGPSAHLRYENYGSVAVPTTAYFFISNPDLKPEQLQTLELSLSHRLTEGLTLGAVAFYTLMSQTISSARLGTTTPASSPRRR